MHKFSHILRLGLKELTSLRHDSVLLMFLLYAFTVAIYMPASSSIIGVHNASVAIIDEDHSPLSRKLSESLLPPEFKTPQALPYDQLDQAMDNGQYTFVINVPANFQADLLAGMGCSQAQGYFYARPMPAQAFLDRVRAQPLNNP